MNELIARAGAVFLAPPVTRRADSPPADLVGVVAPARDLAAAAGGVAAELRIRHGARAVLVVGTGAARARLATPAATKVARRLVQRDLVAMASGALCHVVLPDDPGIATREAWRAIVACAGLPAVIALPGRAEGFDELLASADRLTLALPRGADPAYAELALVSLASLGPPCDTLQLPDGVIARRLAGHGLIRFRPAPSQVTA